MKYPVLEKIVGSDLYTEAAPRKAKDPALKEAEKKFDMPDMSEARFYISETRALGGDWYDVTMSLPVSVNFLKAKDNQLQLNEFMKFGSSDPIEILVMMATRHIEQKIGVRLGRASISTVDLQRQRAKNGMKVVKLDWQIRDAMQAYALGLDLSQWRGASELVGTKEEYQKRLHDAEEARKKSKELRADPNITDEQWKAFVQETQAKGMNHRITRPEMLKSSYPAIAKVLGFDKKP